MLLMVMIGFWLVMGREMLMNKNKDLMLNNEDLSTYE